MSSNCDVIIAGAGAAGLAAAVELAHAGLAVTIVEARDRIGGRMFTRRDPRSNAAVELGAEFVHGRPPEIWDILHRNQVSATEVNGDTWCSCAGRLEECDFFSVVNKILERMDERSPDQSFSEFLERAGPSAALDPRREQSENWARRYVTGFHAADPELISVHALVKGLRAEQKIQGDRAFRIANGYEVVCAILRKQLGDAGVSVQINTPVTDIRWARGEVQARAHRGDEDVVITASRILLTLPLSVFQAAPTEPGALQFMPSLPDSKQRALSQLAMGKVIRVTLCFRERFWETLRPSRSSGSKTLANLSFLLSQDEWFPTWWTTMPQRLPLITGWAPFCCAERLSGESPEFVVDRALETLARLFAIGKNELNDLVEAAYTHDWQSDPFSRGAYSYVKAGGEGAQEALAASVDDTLFFAGEATDFFGHNGTVHGAIASGKRAAAEIIQQFRGSELQALESY